MIQPINSPTKRETDVDTDIEDTKNAAFHIPRSENTLAENTQTETQKDIEFAIKLKSGLTRYLDHESKTASETYNSPTPESTFRDKTVQQEIAKIQLEIVKWNPSEDPQEAVGIMKKVDEILVGRYIPIVGAEANPAVSDLRENPAANFVANYPENK